MYIDSIIVASLIVVIASCVMVGYVARYMWRHIKKDIEKTETEKQIHKLG